MKAITVEPKKPGSVRYEEIPEPDLREDSILVEAIAAAVCGTDIEIAEGKYGWPPPGKMRLVSYRERHGSSRKSLDLRQEGLVHRGKGT